MSICSDCKLVKGVTCCEVFVGDAPSMPLSLPEVMKISKAMGLKPHEFIVVDPIDPYDASEQEILSPVFKSLLTGDARTRLRTVPVEGNREIERCVFLGEQGCKLAKSDRPHGCRLYPFAFNNSLSKSEQGGLVRFPTGSLCLAVEQAPTDDMRLSALLGTNRRELTMIGEQQEKDAATHKRLMTKE
jgi:Fe-S-cluster containining protein